jgi:hypothetical protein
MVDFASLDFAGRVGEVFQRTLSSPRLGPTVRDQLAAIIQPASLGIIAGVLLAWIIGHAFGWGEIIDIIITVAGAFSIGLAVFSGLDELWEFAKDTYFATGDADLTAAAEHLVNAIAILGITAVLGVLFRGRPQTGPLVDASGAVVQLKPLPITAGWRYRPTTEMYAQLPRGVRGRTTVSGDIKISNMQTERDAQLTLDHEKFHSFLIAKFILLRQFRIESKYGSYYNSSLYRYLEEAVAQSYTLVKNEGVERIFEGIAFPYKNGYAYLMKGGARARRIAERGEAVLKGRGFVPEFASLVGTFEVQGLAYELWLAPGETPQQ